MLALASLVGLPGCSALRVAYNTGPTLAWWWLDGYMDFSSEQTPQVKASIERWFAWHRQTQVPVYIALLASAEPHATEPLTPAATCQWYGRIMDALAPALARAVEQAADVLPGIGEEQLRHLEQRYVKVLDEMRREYLQPDKEERLAADVKRALDRAQQVYGRLDEPQRKVISEAVAASPFDAEAWMQERKRRQRDTLATARRLLARRMNAVRVGWPRGPTRAASSDDGSKMGVELAVGSRSAREVSSGCESVGPEPARRGTTGAVGGASDRREQRWASGLCEQRTGERKPMRTGRAQT